MQVGGHEQRVVVEHLLEVRHEPALVHRVAVEAAADEVVHPARGHPVERRHRQLGLAATQQELQRRGRRELRRSRAEAAPLRVVQLAQTPHRREEQRLGQRLRGRRRRGGLPQSLDQHVGPLRHLRAPLAVELRDRDQHLRERRQPVPWRRREVGAAEERLALGREEDGQRPAAAAGHRDHRVHVDPVHVGPLLAVDLDVDEALVHQRRDLRVLERLVRHHVAPVAGRVADGEQDRLVLGLCLRQRLVAPREPLDRIGGVLEQVRARLGRQAIHLCTVTS